MSLGFRQVRNVGRHVRIENVFTIVAVNPLYSPQMPSSFKIARSKRNIPICGFELFVLVSA